MVDSHTKPPGYYDGQREDMLKYIPQDIKTSLEIGCGSGEFSSLVKQRLNTETWAVEINEEVANKAAEKLDNVIIGDAVESLDKVPDNRFDCVILFDVLEHLSDPESLLSALKTKLTSNGVIVASIPNIRYYRVFMQLVMHGNWDYKDQGVLDRTHLRFFTYKSIVKMFDRLNYEILQIEGIHPTSSRTYKIWNTILLNSIADVRYKHFAVVARLRS
jgi:2-polyprenyl-3-methyl-5-hydroxy-6-metoxy-1,4-benzoquinol methylase